MDDLIPFLIFVVVIIVNIVKYAVEKGGKPKPAPKEGAPKPQPSGLEGFFEDLARKLEPKPVEMPEWPEGRDRPDYMKEMEEFEEAPPDDFIQEETAEIIPIPAKMSGMDAEPFNNLPAAIEVPPVEQVASLQSTLKSMPGLLSGIKGVRLPSSTMMRSTTTGRGIDFSLSEQADLRKAMIANMIFGPPRAYDTTFDNSVVK